jgi:hypothetical protein
MILSESLKNSRMPDVDWIQLAQHEVSVTATLYFLVGLYVSTYENLL